MVRQIIPPSRTQDVSDKQTNGDNMLASAFRSATGSAQTRTAISTAAMASRQQTCPQETQIRVLQEIKDNTSPQLQAILKRNHPGKTEFWYACQVYNQLKANLDNEFRSLSNCTHEDIERASNQTEKQLRVKRNGKMCVIDGPKRNNHGLNEANPEVVAQAIMDSVTDKGAWETLQNYRNSLNDDTKFVAAIKPALTEKNKHTEDDQFRWTRSTVKINAEKLQHSIVHNLLQQGVIPSECRYIARNDFDRGAIGSELTQRGIERQEIRNKVQDEFDLAKRQETVAKLYGYITGARTSSERQKTLEFFKQGMRNENNTIAYRSALAEVVEMVERERSQASGGYTGRKKSRIQAI